MKYLKYFELINPYYNFECPHEKLTSLKKLQIPKNVAGSFVCRDNNLKTLKFCPENVGENFECDNNILTSLKFCPEHIKGHFDCSKNQLTSLKFCPKTVGGYFDCSKNQLTSLEFCPEFTGLYFYCSDNNWTNPISYDLIVKYNINSNDLYTDEQKEKFGKYEYQKNFLTETPEKYKDLEPIEYNEKIKEEFDWLFNAADMGLM